MRGIACFGVVFIILLVSIGSVRSASSAGLTRQQVQQALQKPKIARGRVVCDCLFKESPTRVNIEQQLQQEENSYRRRGLAEAQIQGTLAISRKVLTMRQRGLDYRKTYTFTFSGSRVRMEEAGAALTDSKLRYSFTYFFDGQDTYRISPGGFPHADIDRGDHLPFPSLAERLYFRGNLNTFVDLSKAQIQPGTEKNQWMLRTTLISLLPGRQREATLRVWLDPQKDLMPVKAEIEVEGKLRERCRVSDFKRFKEQIWFPTRVEDVTFDLQTGKPSIRRTYQVTSAAFNEAVTESLLLPAPGQPLQVADRRFGHPVPVYHVLNRFPSPNEAKTDIETHRAQTPRQSSPNLGIFFLRLGAVLVFLVLLGWQIPRWRQRWQGKVNAQGRGRR